MVDSQPMEEEFQGATTRDEGTETHGGTHRTSLTNAKTPSPFPTFIKENIDVLRTMIKEHDQEAKIKATPRKLAYADSDKEALARSLAKGFSDRFSLESSGTSDTHKQTLSTSKSQKTPSKNKEPTHLRRSRRLKDRSTTKEKARRERSKSRGKRSRHQEISSDSEYEEGSEDAYEDLRIQRITWKFLEEFSQQKRYAKDPTEIHGIKRRQNEGLQAFMDRFKSESSHIKGVPPVLRIVAFMHGHGHPELAKKLNDKILKTVDEMFESVRAFIRGEAAVGSAEMVRPPQEDKGYAPYPQKDTFTPLIKTPKEILAIESVSFLEPPPLIGTPEKQNLNKFYDYHGDRVKDIRWNNQRNRNQGRNGVKIINMIREEGNRKRPFEEGRFGLMNELTFPTIPQSQLTNEPIILEGIVKRSRVRRILVDGGSSSEIMYEHCSRNLDINARSRLRRCKTPMIGSWKEVQWRQREEKISRIREQAILRARSNSGRRPVLGSVSLEKTRSKEYIEELLADILRENMEVFTWTGSESIVVPRKSSTEKRVFHWLGEGLIRKVRHPEWITNAIPIKLANGTWKVQMDYSSLNKACSKDMYPFPKEGEELSSLMGYLYKCFLRLSKEYIQIRMAEDDEEKTGFHTKEGVYCFTRMPKELKNSAAILQRMMEEVLADQRGRNVEIHLEDIVIKSKSEQNLIQDVKEMLRKLRRVNIKIDPTMSSFGVKEGKFLGHMVTEEGLRADPERIQAIILSPTLRSPNQIRSLFLQLTAISKFIPKLAELKHPLREARMRMETAKEAGWMNEAEEAFRRIKRKLGKLQTLAIPKEGKTLMLCLGQRMETISSALLIERKGI
ncbi:reverse transcriptase domain-containing protein [Tanacetum coccineum]